MAREELYDAVAGTPFSRREAQVFSPDQAAEIRRKAENLGRQKRAEEETDRQTERHSRGFLDRLLHWRPKDG